VPASIAGALIRGLVHDIPADDEEIRRLVPQRLLTFKESVVAALDAESRVAVAARWTEGVLMFRRYRQDYAYYAKRASGHADTRASPHSLWKVATSMGGQTRYFYMNWIWTIREALDFLIGGPGFTRGRRDPHELRVGDTNDYWTVVGLEPGRRITLDFGLKAPGAGILEIEVDPRGKRHSRITVTAYFHPQGIWGLLYWWVLVPFHLFIFKGMTREMARRAVALDAKAASPA